MVRLKRYLDQISASRAVTVDDVYTWVLRYSEELFAELRKFVSTKLTLPEEKADFKRFLQWYMDPSSDDRPVPEGSTLFVDCDCLSTVLTVNSLEVLYGIWDLDIALRTVHLLPHQFLLREL